MSFLEAESIFILREVFAQVERSALLFSGGKDSVVLAELARRAFWPGSIPFFFLHIDTGHNFPEVLEFRDRYVESVNGRLVVASVEDCIRAGRLQDAPSRNALQGPVLLRAIEQNGFQAVIGGGRRDEEKARAKERVFSVRDARGAWEPRKQRPELWELYNGCLAADEHLRVFPLSNWTELDVWEYVRAHDLPLPSLYFAHQREGRQVRFRTVGDMTCSGSIESQASTVEEIIAELRSLRVSERANRLDDQVSDAAMEDRKRLGYF